MNFVRYSPEVEEISTDESETFRKIAETFSKQVETVAKQNSGHAVRASHAKSTGLLVGELIVDEGLPPELAQGLFAKPGRYDVLVRMAQGPGELLDDRISTHRGMSLKILGVTGEHIPEAQELGSQDFVLESGTAFINSDASRFLANLRAGVSNAPHMPEAVKSGVSRLARVASAVVKAVGGEIKTLDFFGHEPTHPLAEAYFSQVPIRYGDYVAKVGLFPHEALLAELEDVRIDASDDADAFRTAVVEYFAHSGAEFDLRIQLCTDLKRMPVEDASEDWPQDESPYRSVARLTLPRQQAHSPGRARYFDERLGFKPANAQATHRPLGQIMRARLFVYERLAELRQQTNHVEAVSTLSASDVPD